LASFLLETTRKQARFETPKFIKKGTIMLKWQGSKSHGLKMLQTIICNKLTPNLKSLDALKITPTYTIS
jgi:hypothetical protein